MFDLHNIYILFMRPNYQILLYIRQILSYNEVNLENLCKYKIVIHTFVHIHIKVACFNTKKNNICPRILFSTAYVLI